MRRPIEASEEPDAYIYQAYFNISGKQTPPTILYVHPPAKAMKQSYLDDFTFLLIH
jgi:hypothetical protein